MPVSHSRQPDLQGATGREHTPWMASQQVPPLPPSGSSCKAACAAWATAKSLEASHMAKLSSISWRLSAQQMHPVWHASPPFRKLKAGPHTLNTSPGQEL